MGEKGTDAKSVQRGKRKEENEQRR